MKEAQRWCWLSDLQSSCSTLKHERHKSIHTHSDPVCFFSVCECQRMFCLQFIYIILRMRVRKNNKKKRKSRWTARASEAFSKLNDKLDHTCPLKQELPVLKISFLIISTLFYMFYMLLELHNYAVGVVLHERMMGTHQIWGNERYKFVVFGWLTSFSLIQICRICLYNHCLQLYL